VPSGFTALISTSSLLLLLGFLIQTTPLGYINGVWHDEGMDGGDRQVKIPSEFFYGGLAMPAVREIQACLIQPLPAQTRP
jgi:hypothetical protein